MLSALGMGCPKSTSTGLEGLFNFHIQEAEFKNTNKKTYKIKKMFTALFIFLYSLPPLQYWTTWEKMINKTQSTLCIKSFSFWGYELGLLKIFKSINI